MRIKKDEREDDDDDDGRKGVQNWLHEGEQNVLVPERKNIAWCAIFRQRSFTLAAASLSPTYILKQKCQSYYFFYV